ncbi:MAG TPA: ABC transporter ATP-binding protein [Deltaproteobacteria bacterium]|nr:ABC transporter ATP-binding protein [Deltaproteobacteria bacterium]
MLEIRHISAFYPLSIQVLEEISMIVKERQIVALLGRKGAGKTTTLKTASGLLSFEGGKVVGGSIKFKGEQILHLPPEEIIQKGMIQVLEGRQEFKHLTIEENLRVGTAARRGKPYRKELDMVYSYFPALLSRRKVLAGRCSAAELQMAVIGRAMMSHPELLLIDEPSLGLAPLLVGEIFRVLQCLNREQDKTIMLGGQNMNMSLQVADYFYLLEEGRIVREGSAEPLRKDPSLSEPGLCSYPFNKV